MTNRAVFDAIAATWPAAHTRRMGPWTLRDGGGAGSRVSATTTDDPVSDAQIAHAEAAGGNLFMLRPWNSALDAQLSARGYARKDPTLVMTAPVATLSQVDPMPRGQFSVWPPMEAQAEIWNDGGITAPRQQVMARAEVPKTSILGRSGNRVGGTAFAAIHNDIAMIHAVEVTAQCRRQGVARNMMWKAAQWAQDSGATVFAVLVTEQNAAARALYTSLGMSVVGNYHYRLKTMP